jgi:hypothetical protein
MCATDGNDICPATVIGAGLAISIGGTLDMVHRKAA